jgi:uncharacterized protein YukE
MDPTTGAAGMRRGAAKLRQRAAELAAINARLDAQIASMAYAGPAAERFRGDMATTRHGIATAAAHVQSLADTLVRNAAATEAALGPSGGHVT